MRPGPRAAALCVVLLGGCASDGDVTDAEQITMRVNEDRNREISVRLSRVDDGCLMVAQKVVTGRIGPIDVESREVAARDCDCDLVPDTLEALFSPADLGDTDATVAFCRLYSPQFHDGTAQPGSASSRASTASDNAASVVDDGSKQ